MRTPVRAPRSASGPAAATAIAADRSSWMPPAKSTSSSAAYGQREQPLDLLLPEREGGARADVAAALEPFEDEPPRSLGEKLLQQSGRGHMQIGPGPGGFERGGLGGPAARDDRVRRPYLGDGGELFAAQLVGGEAEQSDAPVPAGQALGGLGEQFAYILAVHHGEGEKGQPARVGHGARRRRAGR